MNCYTQFVDYGSGFICNLCGAHNEVPSYYQSSLDHQGRPLDIQNKPELQYGCYEAVVDPASFNMKPCEVFIVIIFHSSLLSLSFC